MESEGGNQGAVVASRLPKEASDVDAAGAYIGKRIKEMITHEYLFVDHPNDQTGTYSSRRVIGLPHFLQLLVQKFDDPPLTDNHLNEWLQHEYHLPVFKIRSKAFKQKCQVCSVCCRRRIGGSHALQQSLHARGGAHALQQSLHARGGSHALQ